MGADPDSRAGKLVSNPLRAGGNKLALGAFATNIDGISTLTTLDDAFDLTWPNVAAARSSPPSKAPPSTTSPRAGSP